VASYRFAAHPRWVAGHLLVLAAVVTMVLLGRWQLLVSDRKHFSLQNFGYALQWWAFALFALLFWAKIVRDQSRHRAATGSPASQPAKPPVEVEPPATYRRYVKPAAEPVTDPEIARYNAYLAELAAQAERDRR
jgi:DNA-binding transcriptional regulator of glucitol operon